MDANLVNLLVWTKPLKSTVAIVFVNLCFWFLIRQRPVCVVSLALICYYLRYLWKHRIRPEVLVDPPDHEGWVTLSSYDLENVTCNFGKTLWTSWISLRQENHILWTIGTCTFWIIMAKIGSEMDFLTLLFVISNVAFVIGPLMKYMPKDNAIVVQAEDLIPKPAAATQQWSSPPSPEPAMQTAPSSSLSTTSGVKEFSPEPESLTPAISAMPDHDDSDIDDEFLFDAKHFESSSSSASNSFELIHF